MKSALSHTFAPPLRLASTICAVLLASSCSHLPHGGQETPALDPIAQPAPHLAQLNFGRQAEFGQCTPPACPAVTPKTLAPPAPRPTKAESRPLTPASTLDVGEDIVSPSPRAAAGAPVSTRATTKPFTQAVTVHFKFGDASLSVADQDALDGALAAAPVTRRILISGRTDSIGPADANGHLATRRAHAVRDHLLTRDPGLARLLELDARGACCYLAPNDTERGRRLNRRVDVFFIGDGSRQP